MSEEANGEKTEEPTPKRREKFREDGNLAMSKDVGGVAILAGVLLVLTLNGANIFEAGVNVLQRTLGALARFETGDPRAILWQTVDEMSLAYLSACAAVALVSVVLGAVAGFAQTGGNFTLKSMEFKPEKFNVFKGIQRTLFSAQAAQQVGMALGKAIVVGVALYVVLAGSLPRIIGLTGVSLEAGLGVLGGVFLRLLIAGILAAAALAAADYAMTRYRINEQMKMTKQEVKDEHKQQEGDPQVKARLRQRMRQIGQNQMIGAVAEADVVVVNPTHYAVALAYDPGTDTAPRLLAKGKDLLAAKIREIARKNQVPIVANPPVARAVYATGRVGKEIPSELFEVVARVLAYVFRATGRAAAS